jgi:hypothetical protein
MASAFTSILSGKSVVASTFPGAEKQAAEEKKKQKKLDKKLPVLASTTVHQDIAKFRKDEHEKKRITKVRRRLLFEHNI